MVQALTHSTRRRAYRVVVEIDVELTDPSWSHGDLLDNLPDYLEGLIGQGEAREGHQPYRVSGNVTVWLCRHDCLADAQVIEPPQPPATIQDPRNVRFVTEYIQTDPDDSPSPGLAHYAGNDYFENLEDAVAAGRARMGTTLPDGLFYPCCDWQRQDVPISGFRVVTLDKDGNETGEVWSE